MNFDFFLKELTALNRYSETTPAESGLRNSQRLICNFFGFDFSIIRISGENPESFSHTNPDNLCRDSFPENKDSFPWIFSQAETGRTLAVERLYELPCEACRDHETLERFNIKSFLATSASCGGKIFGCLVFFSRKERPWPKSLTHRLELIAQILGNSLYISYREKKLRSS